MRELRATVKLLRGPGEEPPELATRSLAELAEQLFISPATARTYVSRLLDKLSARDRSQLVILAYESGLVMPGQP
jgi:hypothetical protein